MKSIKRYKEPVLFLIIFNIPLYFLAKQMGVSNMFNTMMNTAYHLLMETAFFLLAICVVMSAFSYMLNEFGVVALLNRLLSSLMKPLYGLPGAASLGIVLTYLTDNPAILSVADNESYKAYFEEYQLPALTNLGTSFGMGLIVTTFVIGIKPIANDSMISAALIGNLGAVIGSIISTRLMLHFCKKHFGVQKGSINTKAYTENETKSSGKLGDRILKCIIDGGTKGVELGMSIVPGVLVVCTFVFMLTNGPSASGAYTGAAYEGVALLPKIADALNFILQPMFGFKSSECISVPITALGAAGAATGIIPKLYYAGAASPHDIAVFVSMCMCWSGYLSTHLSMMGKLGYTELTGKAILSHTIAGLCAGVVTNWIYVLIM